MTAAATRDATSRRARGRRLTARRAILGGCPAARACSLAARCALAGCGSETVAELPAPLGGHGTHPAGRCRRRRSGGCVLDPRAGDVSTSSPRATAGLRHAPGGGSGRSAILANDRLRVLRGRHAGPTRCWSSVGAGVALARRYGLPGGPYGLAVDRARQRLYVTLPGAQPARRAARSRSPPRPRAFATVRQPDSVTVEAGGVLTVTGRRRGARARDDPRTAAPRRGTARR